MEMGDGVVSGLTRPAGLALRATFGSLPSAISTTFRLSRSARLWLVVKTRRGFALCHGDSWAPGSLPPATGWRGGGVGCSVEENVDEDEDEDEDEWEGASRGALATRGLRGRCPRLQGG